MESFATPEELSAYMTGLVSPNDSRSQIILDAATKAIQNYCGWHIAPATDVELILDGGSSVIYLPTLKLNSVTSITVDGTVLAATDYEWSRVTGNIRSKLYGRTPETWGYSGRDNWGHYTVASFPDTWGGIVVSFNSGFAEVPVDLKQIVLQASAQALSSPTGATREQAGQVSMQWATTAPGVAGGLSLLARDLAIVDQYRIAKEV